MMIQRLSCQMKLYETEKNSHILFVIMDLLVEIKEANCEMPCKVGGIGTNVPGLFKAKAWNLLQNL